MAGLAETCSHIAAILYWLETAVRICHNTSCTSKPNIWLPPSVPKACPQVPYVTLEELEKISQRQHSMDTSTKWEAVARQAPNDEDVREFYTSLSSAPNRKRGILSLVSPYSDNFLQSSHHLPPLLQGLYSPKNIHLNYSELLENGKGICNTQVTDLEVRHLEEITRGQVSNKQWFNYRAGRITASLFYQV